MALVGVAPQDVEPNTPQDAAPGPEPVALSGEAGLRPQESSPRGKAEPSTAATVEVPVPAVLSVSVPEQ
eukprot:6028172-Heterocapsa_arctica.AAC.1